MNKRIQKFLSIIVLGSFIFSQGGIIPETFAKSGEKKSQKHFSLADKYKGKQLERVKKGFEGKNTYKVLIQSSKTLDQIKAEYAQLDKKTSIKEVSEGVFQIRFPKSSSAFSSFGSDVDSGSIPASLGGESVIEPEVFQSFDSNYLQGENLDALWAVQKVGADSFQESLSSLPKTSVAILDTGIDMTHPDLANNIDTGLSYDFINESSSVIDDNGHGTQVAGIIGAQVNGSGIFGVDSNTNLVSLKVLDTDGLGTSYDFLEALHYAVNHNIKIVNVSFGGVGDPTTSPVCQAISDAKSKGVFTVVAAGNTNTDVSQTIPAGCSDAITVGAYDKAGNKAAFSNYGTGVDVYAPGVDMYTTERDGSYTTKEGTSFSAPIVSGLIAKELTFSSGATYDEVLSHLKTNYSLVSSYSSVDTQNSSSGSITGTGTSDIVGTGSITGTGGSTGVTPIDYSSYKYYSGTFLQDGKKYGNSLYSPDMNFRAENLTGVDVYTYDQYKAFLKTQKKEFSAMSVPTDGLVGKWDLNGNTNDTSGNGNNGIPVNVTWVDNGGKQVANFGGYYNPGNILVSNSTSLQLTNELTLSYWVKLNDFSGQDGWGWYSSNGGHAVIAKDHDRSGFVSLVSGNYDNGGTFCSGFSNNVFDSPSFGVGGCITQTDAIQNWQHVVYTIGNGQAIEYINGQEVARQENLTIDFGIANTRGISLGKFYDSRYPLNGQIANVAMYNKMLTGSELSSLNGESLGGGGSVADNNTSTNTQTGSSDQVSTNSTNSYDQSSHDALNYIANTSKIPTEPSNSDKQGKGDPVNLATGEFTYENTLMSLPGKKLPFEFKLSYKNQTYYNGPLGINWDHNYNRYLVQEDNGNILYYNGKLGVFRFIKNGNTFDYNAGLRANLSLVNGVYQIAYDSGDIEFFNTDKKLSKIQDIYGNNLQFSYTNGLLTTVTDTLGRTINYTYYDHNRLKDVTDFNGRKAEFTYFDSNTSSGSKYDLQTVTINNGETAKKTISFEYTVGGNDAENHNISKLIDAKGQTYVQNTYQNDRVLTQTYGNGTIHYTYETDAQNRVTKNSVTDRNGNATDYFYDTNGNNTETIYHTSQGDKHYLYTYNSLGYLETMKYPKGNGIKYVYDTRGNLLEERKKSDITTSDSSDDIVTTYTYNSKNQVINTVTPNGHGSVRAYDTKGNLTEYDQININDASGSTYDLVTKYQYSTDGNLTKMISPNGNTKTFTYSGGLLTKTVEGSGDLLVTQSITYDQYGLPIKVIDGNGGVVNRTYTDFSQLASEKSPVGVITSYEYDANNNKTRQEMLISTGVVQEETYAYDMLDNLVKTTQETGSGVYLDTNIVYDANGNIVQTQSGTGAKVLFSYNESGKVIRQTESISDTDDTLNRTKTFEYDLNGNLEKVTDALGNITTYEYDGFDRLLSQVDSFGTRILFAYDKNGNVIDKKVISASGNTLSQVQVDYDSLNRDIKSRIWKQGQEFIQTTKKYHKNGKLEVVIDPKGGVTTFQYDILGRVIQQTDALGNITLYTYDKLGNVTGVTHKNGTVSYALTRNTYDKVNRLIKEENVSTLTGSISHSYNYDKFNNLTKVIEDNGNYTYTAYDYSGHKLSETQYLSGNTISVSTKFTYDEQGNMTSVTDPKGNTTTYTYNNLNELIKTTNADGKFVTYTYDRLGNLVSQTDPNGTTITQTYDTLHRLTARNIQTGSGVLGVTNETYSYDALGRMIQANDSNAHALQFTYDTLGNLTSETQSGSTVNYTYDDNANLTSITNPEGKTTNYSYDVLNRLQTIASGTGIVSSSTYSGLQNTQTTLGNGKITTRTYDDYSRPKVVNNGIQTYTYTYDNANNITSDGTKNYTYDQIYRLTQVSSTNSGMTLEMYNYDKAGNRTSDINNNSYTTNNLNQYTSLSGTTSESFSYDDNGNLKQNGKYNFSYDYKNRLVQVTDLSGSGIVAEFSYDVLGRRYEKKTPTKTIQYLYSNENILEEIQTVGNTTTKKEYINGLGTDDVIAVDQQEVNLTTSEKAELNFCNERVTPYATEFAQYGYTNITERCNSLGGSGAILVTNRYYFHKDNLGSIVGISDNSGTIVTTYDYDSYGNATLNGIDIGNERLFTGREYDTETGLYYNRARYYNPKLGRFISQDPIGQVDDVNLYAYVGNNPVNAVDRSGLSGKPLVKRVLIFSGAEETGTIVGNTTTLAQSVKVQKDMYLKTGYKEEEIQIESGTSIDNFVSFLKNNSYEKIAIVAHSNHNIVQFNPDFPSTSSSITKDTLNLLPNLSSKNTVLTVDGCLSGNGENSIAQQISNQMQVTVQAPDSLIQPHQGISAGDYHGIGGHFSNNGYYEADWHGAIRTAFSLFSYANFKTFTPNN